MISFVEGEVAEKRDGRVVIAAQGVGYDISVPASTVATLPPVGRVARVHTRMVIRDDAMHLYGFSSVEERELFDLLTSVTGVGPKVGLAFLSALTPTALRRAVATGDVAALTVVSGVGRKVAQRVVLDLKDRLGGAGIPMDGPMAEVREALLALGITQQEASEATAGLEPDAPTEDLLRAALQRVGRG